MKRTVISMLKDATIKYPTTNFVYEMTDKGWFGRTFPWWMKIRHILHVH